MKKDVCITKIEQIWDEGKKATDINYLSKALRLLVFYTRTADGVPEVFVPSVQSKIDFLEKLLPSMEVDDASLAIPAIKYSRRQLKVHTNYGGDFKRSLTKKELERVARIGSPKSLNGVSVVQNIQPEAANVFSDLDELQSGMLDDV